MKSLRLLIVDDQELIRESLNIVLDMEEDIEVAGMAPNGQIAVELCEKEQPDVVLMDIHMPVMDGIQATRLIKDSWPQIRVIILTTFQELDYVVEALDIGAEGYLLKAIHPKDLAAGIRLVNRGGTLINQNMARMLANQLKHNEQKSLKHGLSERERQVLECLSQGLSNRETAEKLFLSEGTVKNYISSIYSKLEVRDRLQAVKKARDEGIV
ncbi:MAG: response regulator transcription factor [Desulfotomaculaceae bacterium]|nr:response regulator transcription factor [Desulfotomaculaceae bacterium]